MVSLAVFLSFINDAMPKTSSSISRLALYVDLLLVQSCLSFLATLTVLRGHYHVERLDQLDKERRLDSGDKEPGICIALLLPFLSTSVSTAGPTRRGTRYLHCTFSGAVSTLPR